MAEAPTGISGPLSGSIEQGVLRRLLRDLYVQRRTGLLHFARGRATASVCFINGHIVWGQSSLEEARLGPVLLKHGFVSREALDQVTELVGGGKRLGDLLLELGSLDRDTLNEALALQVRETLLAVLAWSEGSWRFEEQPAEFFKGYDHALRISTAAIIMDAASLTDPAAVLRALGDLERPLALTTDPLLRFQRVTLSATDTLLVSKADGVRTTRETLALAGEDAEQARRSLFGLLCIGLLEFVEAPPPVPEEEELPLTREEVLRTHRGLATRDHFEVLGLLRTSTEAEASASFARLARRFHPDAHHDPELADLRRPLEEIFTRLADAERVLSHPRRRAEYEKRLVLSEVQPLLQAPEEEAPAPGLADPAATAEAHEQVLAQAEKECTQGRYWDALQVVEGVLGELQGRQRRRAQLLRARIYSENPKWRKEAEDQLKEVLAEDPANTDALFLLGQIYKAGGMASRAQATFRKVLELKPRHAGAQEELSGKKAG